MSAFLLKVGDGGTAPKFATVAGLRTTAFKINGGDGLIAEMPKAAAVSVAGTGVFTGSAAETRLKGNALGGALDDYELSFEGGERLRGRFLVTRLDYAGDYSGERTYHIALESSGPVVSL